MSQNAIRVTSGAARRRILLLSPFAPRLDASMGGPVVIAQLIMALSQREHVALLYLRGPDELPLDDRVKAACQVTLETRRPDFHTDGAARRKGMGPAACAVRGIPSWVADWWVPEFGTTLTAFAAGWQPDVVQAEFHLMGQYLRLLDRCRLPTVLNQHEPGAAAAADRRCSGLMPGYILPWLDVHAWRHYERRLAKKVDAIVTFTERDRKAMRGLERSARVEVIAPGTLIPDAAYNPRGIEPPALLFFGNYLHAPNVDAALRLARNIYPSLRAETPDLRLWLLGDRAPAELTAMADEQLCVPGRVPELSPYLDEASVVVAPLRIGGGMRVKMLEALAAGKAVVASRLAAEGMNLVDGEHVLYAESDKEFVHQVTWLLRRPDDRAALARRARAWAVSHLSWDRAAAQYAALYEDLLRQPRGAGVGDLGVGDLRNA